MQTAKKKKQKQSNNGLGEIQLIKPKTFNQRRAFNSYYAGKNLMMHGSAGSGKSFLCLYFGLNDVISHELYDKVVIVRSAVPTRDQGFMPGNLKEKSKLYETPYASICTELFGRGDAYDILKQHGKVEFITTSYIRGLTIDNAVFVIDEMQNMTWKELTSVLTRVGENCKVLLCGDTKQSDLNERTGKNDILKLISVCSKMGSFDFIQMTRDDIQRSGFVKEFIIKCEELGY